MANTVVSLLCLSGLFSFSHCLSGQYHFEPNKLSWNDAQKYCREKYSDLATVESPEDNTRFKSFKSCKEMWIGLHYVNWKWSLDGRDLEQTQYKMWADEEPDNQGGHENCVALYKKSWIDRSCNRTYSFLCYDATARGPRQYVLIAQPKTWSDAQRYCRENHTDLASDRNREEHQFLDIRAGGKKVWIGLFRGTWQWSDQSTSKFRAWHANFPKNNSIARCALYNCSDSLWYEDECTKNLPFFCQSVTHRQVVKITFKSDSPLNMEDPAVQAAIAEQIYQKLLAEGQPVTNVTWRRQPDGRVFHENQNEDAKKRGEL